MNKSHFYTILDYQLRVLKDLEELEFALYRSSETFDPSKMELVTEAKQKIEQLYSYLEDMEKELFPEEYYD
jgi:hypothetical protein